MKVLIVDDDDVMRALIADYVNRFGGLEIAAEFDNAVDAAAFLQENTVDLILLDVEMPVMSGLELARFVQAEVILVTARPEYAPEAFEIGTTDYLVKPVTYARFYQAIRRVQERLRARSALGARPPDDEGLFVKADGRYSRLTLAEIEWIEAQGDYLFIKTARRKYFVHGTMKAMMDKLPTQDFIRVHRSYIVRMDKVEDIAPTSIVITGETLPVGATYRDALLERIKMM